MSLSENIEYTERERDIDSFHNICNTTDIYVLSMCPFATAVYSVSIQIPIKKTSCYLCFPFFFNS